MPRKGHVPKRDPIADPIYSSTLVTKFVNAMMWGGKKSTAQGIFYKCMENLQSKGGDNYQVPVEVNPDRRTSLAIRWIVSYARGRGEKGMVDKLSNELLDAANGRGAAIKKKEDVHRMAEANKAFAHYRW